MYGIKNFYSCSTTVVIDHLHKRANNNLWQCNLQKSRFTCIPTTRENNYKVQTLSKIFYLSKYMPKIGIFNKPVHSYQKYKILSVLVFKYELWYIATELLIPETFCIEILPFFYWVSVWNPKSSSKRVSSIGIKNQIHSSQSIWIFSLYSNKI